MAQMYDVQTLDKEAVEVKELSTNFIDIISDCEGIEGFDAKSEIQERFPLATWLLNTPFARSMRARSTDPQIFRPSAEEGVKWEMTVPGSVWTLNPVNSSAECCWVMPDFAKCSSVVPMYLLCLKDCDSIFDRLVYDRLRINAKGALDGIARTGESVGAVNRRIARLWMAFYTANTIILGTKANATNILKPFNGLVEVLENPAVAKIYGGNILAAFDELGCRLSVLGGLGNMVVAVHPLIFDSIDAEIKYGQFGDLPDGWSRANGVLRYKGVSFLRDERVPVDMTAGTGEAWVLDGNSVGAFLATNLMPESNFIFDSGIDTSVDNCGSKCDYYYNFGAVANNNANRLAVITDIPVKGACTTSLADLAGLIVPTTLIPGGVTA